MINIPNYQIGTQIYESANSLVYRGIRKKDNQPVILKVLKEDYPTPEELTRYRQEYDITRLLADFEGVVKAYRLEKHQNTLVICLEDFGGKSLKIWRDLQRTFTLDELLTFAIRIADSLGQIHRQNIIHKDINPSNIVLNPNTNVLKIIDFGISTQLTKQHLTLKNPEVLEGTLAYMSPEQTGRMNRTLDYRTDFYSLGVTFYELFTGIVPFDSTDAMELVHCHIAKQPTPPHQIHPDVPPIISDIVTKLMAKNAEDRYQSALGIKADLEECKLQFAKTGQISHFSLAQQDISARFKLPQKLYGRELEIDTLVAAFERVASGTAEMMLVAGYSGIGKSVLVKEIYQSLSEKQGYFISGKFDQFQRNIPYSAMVNAFKELVQQLLTENKERLSVWKEKLIAALGPNGQVIIDVLPEIEWIIGSQPKAPQLGLTESQNRFNLVFQNFMRVFCQPEHPLVMFLDDLQWVDSATLKLLELVMTYQDNTSLFLIGAYRDNEVDPTHPLMMTLNNLREESVTLNQITLKPLAFEQINQLIAESLRHDLEAVSALTDLVMRKTGGNPFFVNQFMHTLYEEDLLKLTYPDSNLTGFQNLSGLSRWTWDIAKIDALNITDNVVDLMIGKLKKLPGSAQHVLRLAACIGNRFDLETLSVIYEKSVPDTFQDLMPILMEEFILPKSEPEMMGNNILNESFIIRNFQFLHDRIQQAAYSLIEENQQAEIHLQIARLMSQHLSESEQEERLFEIVGHFNHGLALIANTNEINKVIKFNVIASQTATAATAYQSALKFIQTSVELLPENSWQNQYPLTFEIYQEWAKIAYLNGEFEKSDEVIDNIFRHAKTNTEKASIYSLRVMQYTMRADYNMAIQAGKAALALLGIQLPETDFQTAIQTEMETVIQNLAGRDIASLLDLPWAEEEEKKIAINLLISLAPPFFISGQTELYVITIVKSVNLSLQFGNLLESAFAYSAYGVLLGPVFGNYLDSAQFADLALKLSEKVGDKVQRCKVCQVVGGLTLPWLKPMALARNILVEGYQAGLDSGEFQFAGFCFGNHTQNTFSQGENMLKHKNEVLNDLSFFNKINNQLAFDMITSHLFIDLNLLGLTHDKLAFHSDTYTESKLLTNCEESNDSLSLFTHYTYKSLVLYLYERYEEAYKCAEKAIPYKGGVTGLICSADHIFYHSLSLAALYGRCSGDKQNTDLEQLTTNQSQMKIWANSCPENFWHKYILIEAELARIQGDDLKTMDLYDQAIESAKANGFIQNEAIANELAAKFWRKKGKTGFARLYMLNAHYAYQQWGAQAKVKDLEERYPQFLSSKTARAIPTTEATLSATQTASIKSSGQWLDLNSIMKAAQTLSGEMVLDRLLEKMMHVVIENAGASSGFLLLPKQDCWFIEAQWLMESSDTPVLQKLPLEETDMVPANIIHYVAHTFNHVVLHNATQEGSFTRDAYIVKRRPKSVLCVPLVNQGHTTGILYLENSLTTGAFTPERLEVLNLLSSQIAISIENSLLYNNLEQKVAERTNKLSLSEARYRELFDNMNSGVAVYDAVDEGDDFIFREFNRAGEKIEDLKREDIIGKRVTEVFPGIKEFGLFKVFQRVWQSGKPEYFSSSFYKDNYRKGWRENDVYKLPSGEIVAVYDDISERIQAQEEILTAKEAAESANKAKSTFLANMSHELRTPLNGVLGYAQILQRDSSLTTGQQHGLNVIEQSGNHLLALINDILDLAKVESGKIELYQRDFNLPSLLSGVSEIIKIRTERKGIDFYLESADELPNGVHGDERGLRQILLNLLGNAIKFTDLGNVTLKVNVNKGDNKKKPRLHFKIEDTGIGISPEHLARIFEPFEQVGDQEHQAKGTGLGLAISKHLVELMGGQLCVSSQLNMGTQFWFELALPVVAYNKAQVTQQPIIGIKGDSPKILVVDDNLDNQAVLIDLLSPLGFKVKSANNGHEGLETALKWQPDVIITDLVMPEMDGFEFIQSVRQSPVLKNIVIIVTSASTYKEDKKKSLAVGSNAFLPKPIPVETLFEQLQQLLNLTWDYGDKIKETTEQNHNTQMVFPPIVELEKLYELSLIGDVDELEEQAAILAESDVKLKPFVTQMQTLLKKYQLEELSEWLVVMKCE